MDPLSPWVIVVVFAVDLFGLVKLSRTHGWRVRALASIPLAFVLLYGWVALYNPNIESVRSTLRYVLLYSGGVGGYVVFDFLIRTSGNIPHRRHDDR